MLSLSKLKTELEQIHLTHHRYLEKMAGLLLMIPLGLGGAAGMTAGAAAAYIYPKTHGTQVSMTCLAGIAFSVVSTWLYPPGGADTGKNWGIFFLSFGIGTASVVCLICFWSFRTLGFAGSTITDWFS